MWTEEAEAVWTEGAETEGLRQCGLRELRL